MGKRIKYLKVSIYHQGCSASKTSEKFPEIRLEQASPVTYLRKKKNQVDYQLLWNIYAPDKQELDKYLKALRDSEGIISIEVLKRTDTEALVLWTTRAPSSSYDSVLKSNIMYSSPVTVERGYEIHNVLSTHPDHMKKMLGELSNIGQMKILRIGDYEKSEIPIKLTKKQEESLNLAFTQGYYRWPKKVTLEDLASMQDLSRRSFQERLRRAESKLFSHYLRKSFGKKKP
ncbi:MAG: helix-turn-helix domain-containing protein [Candidatus Micrarchaeota archaeon]